jgi:hypothetical protein
MKCRETSRDGSAKQAYAGVRRRHEIDRALVAYRNSRDVLADEPFPPAERARLPSTVEDREPLGRRDPDTVPPYVREDRIDFPHVGVVDPFEPLPGLRIEDVDTPVEQADPEPAGCVDGERGDVTGRKTGGRLWPAELLETKRRFGPRRSPRRSRLPP